MMPKINAPTGRAAKVANSVAAMAGSDRLKSLAIASCTITRMKKSKASRVHPRKPAIRALRALARCSRVMGGTATAAFACGELMGGFGKQVILYVGNVFQSGNR